VFSVVKKIAQFRLKMKSLSIKIKFTIIAIFISLMSFGAAAYFSTRWMADEIREEYKSKAMLMSAHVLHDLEDSMLRKTHEEIHGTLNIYKAYKEVKEIRIFSPKGKEVFSVEERPAEARVEEVLRTGEPVHFSKRIKDLNVTTFMIPLKNKPKCHGCHDPSEAARGVLLLSLSQEEMEQYLGQQRMRFLVLFGFIALGVSGITVLAVNRLFLNPLKPLQKGAEAVEKGDFKYQIPLKSNDEVGALIRNFNHMTQTLRAFFEEINEKNTQLNEQFKLLSCSQKEWQETFDCITDPIAIMTSDCTILRANRAFRETFKEALKELPPASENGAINRKCRDLFGTCLLPDCRHKKSVQDRTMTTQEIRDERTGKLFEVTIFPYYSPEEDFTGSVAVMKDITERKENEMRLIMNERLAALGQMASGIAHEINTPLGTIAASTEGLIKRVRENRFDPLFFEGYLRIIEEEVGRSKDITNRMLSFVRGAGDIKRQININEVLDKTMEIISLLGRVKDIVVLRKFQPEMPGVQGNEGELRQVFTSIITNALDAMEDHGTLSLETGVEGNSIVIKISDTGPGIPPKVINRIFDPFFSTKLERGGTGLGLSIASAIIKENGGRIEVTSEEGKGATFTISLPI